MFWDNLAKYKDVLHTYIHTYTHTGISIAWWRGPYCETGLSLVTKLLCTINQISSMQCTVIICTTLHCETVALVHIKSTLTIKPGGNNTMWPYLKVGESTTTSSCSSSPLASAFTIILDTKSTSGVTSSQGYRYNRLDVGALNIFGRKTTSDLCSNKSVCRKGISFRGNQKYSNCKSTTL